MKKDNNTKIYRKNINKCREDIIYGIQILKNETEYNLGKTMSAASNIGNKENQEDSVLILEHPQNKRIKLIAVADGVGGEKNGEQASKYLLRDILITFEIIPSRYYKDLTYINEVFQKKLLNTNNEILEKDIGKTTLSMAIVSEKETLIISAGDSRIYTYKNKKLTQITEDDSYVQELYKLGIIEDKNLLRFHIKSNEITNCFGIKDIEIKSKTIKNNYDSIIGVTDGVTDCLSEKQLETVLKNNSENQAQEIVIAALNNTSICDKKYQNNLEYLKEIPSGKDNTTAAVIKNKH